MRKSEISPLFMKYLPARNQEILVGDHFMVIQPSRRDYEVIYQCTGIDPENRICKENESIGLSNPLISKVELFTCSTQVSLGEQIVVNYNIYLPDLIIRVYDHGIITGEADKKYWFIINSQGKKCMAPKQHTFKIVELSNGNNGNRTTFNGCLREPAPS